MVRAVPLVTSPVCGTRLVVNVVRDRGTVPDPAAFGPRVVQLAQSGEVTHARGASGGSRRCVKSGNLHDHPSGCLWTGLWPPGIRADHATRQLAGTFCGVFPSTAGRDEAMPCDSPLPEPREEVLPREALPIPSLSWYTGRSVKTGTPIFVSWWIMSRKKKWLWFGIALAFVVAVYLVMRPGAPEHLLDPAGYMKIRKGMTLAEVEAILGPAGDYTTGPTTSVRDGWYGAGDKEWITDNGAISVWFDSQGKIIDKDFANVSPRTGLNWFERLQMWLGLKEKTERINLPGPY
jgi:hypothetical protein